MNRRFRDAKRFIKASEPTAVRPVAPLAFDEHDTDRRARDDDLLRFKRVECAHYSKGVGW
jgi:hypothetical protein